MQSGQCYNLPAKLLWKDCGLYRRPAWYVVLLVDDPETIQIFKEEVEQGHVDEEDYGKVLKSGWGRDPPQEVEDWLDRVGKGLETLIY